MSLFPSFGGAAYKEHSVKVIRLLRKGCTNRPFFHISVQENTKEVFEPVIEQIGSYDPYPNKYNEKLVAIDFKRLEDWLRAGAIVSAPVKTLLGLAGYFPIYPVTYERAWKNRFRITKAIEDLKATVAELENLKLAESLDLPKSSQQSDSSAENAESNPDGPTQGSPETKVDKE